jgi:hypothetical protein
LIIYFKDSEDVLSFVEAPPLSGGEELASFFVEAEVWFELRL